MKSTPEHLTNRGFIDDGTEENFRDLSPEERVSLLSGEKPTDRTLGARLLNKDAGLSAVNPLIDALKREKKLSPKLEICNSLVSYGKEAVGPLIEVLGRIGTNQYRDIPDKKFIKKNYPLPRDIAARTLGRIGTAALPDLLIIVEVNDPFRLSEAVDAIGYICFYRHHPKVFEILRNSFHTNEQNDLLRWKIFRALSAFPESENFLKAQLRQIDTPQLRHEIERSLSFFSKH